VTLTRAAVTRVAVELRSGADENAAESEKWSESAATRAVREFRGALAEPVRGAGPRVRVPAVCGWARLPLSRPNSQLRGVPGGVWSMAHRPPPIGPRSSIRRFDSRFHDPGPEPTRYVGFSPGSRNPVSPGRELARSDCRAAPSQPPYRNGGSLEAKRRVIPRRTLRWSTAHRPYGQAARGTAEAALLRAAVGCRMDGQARHMCHSGLVYSASSAS